MCFNATSSLVGGCCAYGVAAYLLRRDNPRLKWGAVALMGITAMQWTEAVLWLDGPKPHGIVNQLVFPTEPAGVWGAFTSTPLRKKAMTPR